MCDKISSSYTNVRGVIISSQQSIVIVDTILITCEISKYELHMLCHQCYSLRCCCCCAV